MDKEQKHKYSMLIKSLAVVFVITMVPLILIYGTIWIITPDTILLVAILVMLILIYRKL